MSSETIRVAIYARVSSDQQARSATVSSQVEALKQRIKDDGHTLDEDCCFIDEGFSGMTLVRPSLERLRDAAYTGAIDLLYVHSPDRLARRYAYQVLLIDEFERVGLKTIFLNREIGKSPEDELLLQVQGVIAEYERAKILERARRGKRHAARRGSLSVMGAAPFGYRYVTRAEGGGEAHYQVVLDEARIVRQLFEWVGCEGLSVRQTCRRLAAQGIRTRTGRSRWSPGTVATMLRNTAYKGLAAYGKTQTIERQAQIRERRLVPGQRRLPKSSQQVCPEKHELIPVPALISDELFAAVADRLAENQRRNRERKEGAKYLLQGLVVCARCGYAYTARQSGQIRPGRQKVVYLYYRCTGRNERLRQDEPTCGNTSIRLAELDDAVWQDVCQLLRDPDRVKREYERRLRQDAEPPSAGFQDTQAAIHKVKRGITRLIDAYENGLIGRDEFEPRIGANKERLARLEQQAELLAADQEQYAELRMAIGHLQEFSQHLTHGLAKADFFLKREIVRALIKRIEIDEHNVRIVYRVSPHPFVQGPADGAILQHCRRRQGAATTTDRRFSRTANLANREPIPFERDCSTHTRQSH